MTLLHPHKWLDFGGTVVRSALVRGPARIQARLFAVGACAVISGAVATAGGAETPATVQQRAAALRHANTSLAARSHAALLGLYSLDSQLGRAEARLAALRSEAARIAQARRAVRHRLGIASRDLQISQRQLALRLHSLYEQPGEDPLAIILGAESLDEAITSLDDLSRAAQQNKRVAAESRRAQTSLTALAGKLRRQDAQVSELAASAAQSASSLSAAIAARKTFVSTLASRQRLNISQISSLEAQASRSVVRSQELASESAPAAPTSTSEPISAPTLAGGRTITVQATGYSLPGTTASGIPVGWGVVAVDPSFIPLGTRMTIPGYGEAVAADTGSAVQGAIIDLWFPTTAQALQWGRRTVTITIR
jgi:3D (Asp-Asp-Asp) domain-containing protein/septal ring factor EnvC (AmiA/AmiB activator)